MLASLVIVTHCRASDSLSRILDAALFLDGIPANLPLLPDKLEAHDTLKRDEDDAEDKQDNPLRLAIPVAVLATPALTRLLVPAKVGVLVEEDAGLVAVLCANGDAVQNGGSKGGQEGEDGKAEMPVRADTGLGRADGAKDLIDDVHDEDDEWL